MQNQIYTEVDSPMALFNNFMVAIGEQLSEIYEYDLFKNNDIIFDNDSILLFGYIKLCKNTSDELQLLIKKPIVLKLIKQVKLTIDNFRKLEDIYCQYMTIFNDISKNYDSSITERYITIIFADLCRNNISKKVYFIPHRHKIANEIQDNDTLANLYNKFAYGLTFHELKTPGLYKYSIIRMIASDLNESKCIANIRPLEIDTVITGKLTLKESKDFLTDLMYYGKIRNITETSI